MYVYSYNNLLGVYNSTMEVGKVALVDFCPSK